jgi:demethylmenaquinone methyltransferase/2-methoxy-6-polyprenyl-1,4-benzoquinol methylase
MEEIVAVPTHVGGSVTVSMHDVQRGPDGLTMPLTIEESTVGRHGPHAAVDKSGGRVRGMFAEIAPRYDLVNRLLSGGIDVLWRRTTVRRAPPPPAGGAMLDLCTGTGDLALAYARAAGPGVRIVAGDFCRPMLDRGEQKSHRAGLAIEWVEADAMDLPFPAAAFDLVTVAFGLRNIADTARGLAEMARVLKPGGRLAILEFSLPTNPLVRGFYLWYFRRVLPFLGNAVARNRSDAYTYLNKSVEEFPAGERLAALIGAAGFDRVTMVPLTFGIATLSIATRAAGKAE